MEEYVQIYQAVFAALVQDLMKALYVTTDIQYEVKQLLERETNIIHWNEEWSKEMTLCIVSTVFLP